jgi:hypothetical protein
MGRDALQGRREGSAGTYVGEATGSRGIAARSRHRALAWKLLGRPACLPAPIPLDPIRFGLSFR